jgi:hypothetical protein
MFSKATVISRCHRANKEFLASTSFLSSDSTRSLSSSFDLTFEKLKELTMEDFENNGLSHTALLDHGLADKLFAHWVTL